MLRKTSILIIVFISSSLLGFSQILGGGTQFSNAVIFNQSWLTGCPAAGTSLSNQVAFEPTTALDACAPAPVCNTGTTGSDIWFSFFAQTSTASIVINPSASFNVAIQAFSGTACPGLTTIGCVDAGGNNAIETLNLTGLTINQVYYFRVFGSSNGVSNRTGTYTFCGSTQLGSSVLAVEISSFNGSRQNNNVVLNWVTESESNNAYFEVEKSIDGVNFQTVGKVAGAGTTSLKTYYNFTDIAVLQTDIVYYRLKEVSNGGIYKHSTTIIIRGDNKLKNTVAILNNPVNDKIKISVSADAATKIDFKIINSIGQVVCNQSNTLVKGNNIFAITRLNNIYKGLYTLQATINNQIQNIRFVCVQ